MFVREMERVEIRGRQARVDNRTNVNYVPCHSPRTVRSWGAETCENIFRDVEIRVLDLFHRLRVLWSVFSEKSVI